MDSPDNPKFHLEMPKDGQEALGGLRASFSKEDWERFSKERKKIVGFEEVQSFLNSVPFISVFAEYWKTENGIQWRGRNVRVNFAETVLHTLTLLSTASVYERMGEGINGLGEATQDEIKRVENISRQIARFLRDRNRT